MPKGFFNVPVAKNEPVKSYNPGSPERKELKSMIAEMRSKIVELPMCIGGKEVKSTNKIEMRPPHDFKHLLGYFYQGDESHVTQAIDAALAARSAWSASILFAAQPIVAPGRRGVPNGSQKRRYMRQPEAEKRGRGDFLQIFGLSGGVALTASIMRAR